MLTLSLAASVVVHVPLYFAATWAVDNYFSAKITRNTPVKMVRVNAQAWDASMAQARAAQRRPGPSVRRAPGDPAKRRTLPKKKEDKKKEKRERTKIDGQIVEVPPSADDSPNPNAKFLSKQNTHVKKESVARIEERDPNKKRVTNRLQERDVSPARPRPGSVPTKGLTVEGTGDRGDQPGEGDGPGQQRPRKKTVIKVPDMAQRDAVKLKLSEFPGDGLQLPNRRGNEALRGNGDRLQLQLGEDMLNSPNAPGGKRGSPNAADGLPSLSALKPTVGTIARISGSPSRDHVEGLPEGDGTFLNTKQFKYATFFFRVRDSVATQWDDLVSAEYRRRDPTGNIYGVRDRATLLSIELSLDGRLTGVRIANSSGVDFLDSVAVQAFKMAQPFPNPPMGIADEDGNIRFNFQFTVVRSRGPFNLFR